MVGDEVRLNQRGGKAVQALWTQLRVERWFTNPTRSLAAGAVTAGAVTAGAVTAGAVTARAVTARAVPLRGPWAA